MKKKILIPIPKQDFDPTEVAIPFHVLTNAGFEVKFATEDAKVATADPLMLTGEGLDPWGFIPGLKKMIFVGAMLRANRTARIAYQDMQNSAAFCNPLAWEQINADEFDGLLLPGGHKKPGMLSYLESQILQSVVVQFNAQKKPIAAICHGVLLAARSIDLQTQKSVLYDKKVTALTWKMEKSASLIVHITRFWDPTYYRTYLESKNQPAGHMSVESEVKRNLASPHQFQDVPLHSQFFKKQTSGVYRDTIDDESPAFVVSDQNFVTARWPGDAHTFAKKFIDLLKR